MCAVSSRFLLWRKNRWLGMTLGLMLVLLVQASLMDGTARAENEPKAAAPLECRFAEVPPVIDGVVDEAVWREAMLFDKFALPWLGDQARAARTATRARLMWDREFLYFAAEMDDADLFADVTEHDGKTWDNDVFELFFKPATDKTGYYEFQVNAAGTKLDMFLPERGKGGYEKHAKDWTFHLEAKVRTNGTLNQRTDRDTGWTVEGRLPWTDFVKTGGRPAVDEVWKFALCRYDYSNEFDKPELSSLAPLKVASFHQHEDYADLKFVRGKPAEAVKVTQSFNAHAKLPKFTTSRVAGSPEPPSPYQTERRYPNLKVNHPIAVVAQPGSDRIWTITQDRSYSTTVIQRFVDSPDVSELETLLPEDKRVAYDIVFHPRFADNGYVYVGHNRAKPLPKTDADNSADAEQPANKGDGKSKPESKKEEKYSGVSRFKMNPRPPYEFDPSSEVTIIEWPSDGHNGAAITFGLDGMLYVTSGDGTSDSDTNLRGQEMTHLTAKVLRINVDHPAEGKMYSVPKDNPFVGQANIAPETWAFGLRNPWRMTTDRKTGHIWVGNNGQDLWEQVYFVRKGDNYGWSVYEGSHPFYLTRELGPTPHVKPALEHHHSESRSLTGGIVYHGRKRPELAGCYIYGDHSTGKIWGARHNGQKITFHQELVDTPFHISGFGTDSQGEILICDHAGGNEGGYYTLVLRKPDAERQPPFPTKLSETGLFQSVAGHVMEPSLIPYSVNAPLWSDGTEKARYFAIPGDAPKIEFQQKRAWGLPNGTVTVKSFSIETTEGDTSTRKWIETRVMTKQQNEWVGYSYQWNDEQTEATLVPKEGLDRNFTVKRKQPNGDDRPFAWHYPSRTECMVCHSRAAGFVLGLTTAQMNRVHDYDTGSENQLSVLERLGLLPTFDWMSDNRNRLKDDLKKEGLDDKTIAERMATWATAANQRTAVRSTLLSSSPDKYERLANPYDPKEKLADRARAYLHSNCSICHIEAGGGNAQMQLEYATERDKMKLFDEVPVHDKFNLPDARLVAPGHPERSVLLHRVARRGRGQMPQLGTNRVDEQAVTMLREWIASMEK